jgi:hypothetical protein
MTALEPDGEPGLLVAEPLVRTESESAMPDNQA